MAMLSFVPSALLSFFLRKIVYIQQYLISTRNSRVWHGFFTTKNGSSDFFGGSSESRTHYLQTRWVRFYFLRLDFVTLTQADIMRKRPEWLGCFNMQAGTLGSVREERKTGVRVEVS